MAQEHRHAQTLFCESWIVVYPQEGQLRPAKHAKHAKKARDIKERLYGVDDLRHLNDKGFKKKALDHIKPSAMKKVYRYLPEVRLTMRLLSWNSGANLTW